MSKTAISDTACKGQHLQLHRTGPLVPADRPKLATGYDSLPVGVNPSKSRNTRICEAQRDQAPIHWLAKQGRKELSTAAVERGPSQAARSGSKESSSRLCSANRKTPRLPPFSSLQAWSLSLLAGGLNGLPLRVSNEGLLRPRVARAQETNGLPLSSYTGRGAKPVGLVSDKTRILMLPQNLLVAPSSHLAPTRGCRRGLRA